MKKGILWVGVILLISTMGSCASVPRESVEMSREIGKGIVESQRSYTAVLNAYFEMKKQQVDQWIESKYIPEFMSNVTSQLEKEGKPTTLSPEEMTKVLQKVIEKRDEMISELEKARILILTTSEEHYILLAQGNHALTAFLQSVVEVKEALASTMQLLEKGAGTKVDWDKLDAAFSNYLKEAGTDSSKAIDLYEKIKSTIDKGE